MVQSHSTFRRRKVSLKVVYHDLGIGHIQFCRHIPPEWQKACVIRVLVIKTCDTIAIKQYTLLHYLSEKDFL